MCMLVSVMTPRVQRFDTMNKKRTLIMKGGVVSAYVLSVSFDLAFYLARFRGDESIQQFGA